MCQRSSMPDLDDFAEFADAKVFQRAPCLNMVMHCPKLLILNIIM